LRKAISPTLNPRARCDQPNVELQADEEIFGEVFLSGLAVVAALFLGAANDPLQNDTVSNGPVIELDVIGLQSGLASGTRFTLLGAIAAESNSSNGPIAGALVPPLVTPAVRVGWEANQNVFLVGLQVLLFPGANGQPAPFEVAMPLTYRHYFKLLVKGGFAPFAEASVDLDLWGAGGSSNQVAYGVGGEVGFGGEWLFARNFGLFGKAVLGIQGIPPSFLSTPNTVPSSGNYTIAVGIGGVLGILVHL
jgi:hypothetical protein